MKAIWITSALIFVVAITPASSEPKTASCGLMQKLAQEHASSMARRDSLDHVGFEGRARRGARAENVAFGHTNEAKTVAQWRVSPPHAANMRLPGCKAVAYAISTSGRYYWAMVIGK